jgi:hypothetical protein
VRDRATKFSQILEMGELCWKLAVLAAGMSGSWPGCHARREAPFYTLGPLAIDNSHSSPNYRQIG